MVTGGKRLPQGCFVTFYLGRSATAQEKQQAVSCLLVFIAIIVGERV